MDIKLKVYCKENIHIKKQKKMIRKFQRQKNLLNKLMAY